MLRRVARPVLGALGRDVLLQRRNALPFDPISTNWMKKSKRYAKEKHKGKRNKKTPTTKSGVIAGIACGRKELHRRKNSANWKNAEGVSHQ